MGSLAPGHHAWSEAHRPYPTTLPVRTYVWELPVRVSHWFIVLAIAVLSFTGYYMHNPFIVATSTTTFLMARVRFIHEVAAAVFISAFLLRMYWFFVGNDWSNWRSFWPIQKRQWRGMGQMVAYYSFLRKDLVHYVGHNALAAVTYLVMFTFMLIEIITGLTLYTYVRGTWLLGWLFRWISGVIDIQYLRLMHFCIMFTFFAFVIHHVYSAILVVLGLGNILHGDDGAGPQVISRLRADRRVPADVSLVEGGTLGLELLPYVWDCGRLIVIDAIDVGEVPGTLVKMSGEELDSLPTNSSVHQLGVSDLLVALRMLADRQPEVVLLGVQPENTDWSSELSPGIAANIDSLVEAVIRELQAARV